MEHNLLKIFVASPGDLLEERAAIHGAVQRINKTLGRHIGWHIDLYGWEDTRPGFSRPQELINKDVDGCELFIGMLFARWGYPTGEFSSGFEEEFTRAIERRRKTNQPEMWLHFKAIPKDLLADPGEQLKKVLRFRSQQQEARELLYKEFTTIEGFGELIFDSLTSYLLQLDRNRTTSREGVHDSETGKAIQIPDSQDDVIHGGPLPEELNAVLRKAISDVPSKGIQALGSEARLRLYLGATAWFASDKSEILLHTHHQNLVYRLRKDWDVTELERLLLVRTFVGGDSDTEPGWYWFNSEIYKDITEMLWKFAIDDGNQSVQQGAAKLLRDIGQLPKNAALVREALYDKEIAATAIDLVLKSKDQEWIDVLNDLVSDSQYSHTDRALAAIAGLTSLSDQDKGFQLLVERTNKLPPDVSTELFELFSRIDIEKWMSAVEMGSSDVKKFAIDQIKKLGPISKSIAQRMLAVDSIAAKEGAVDSLFDHGTRFSMLELEKLFPDKPKSLLGLGLRPDPGAKKYTSRVFAQESDEQLTERIDLFNPQSATAYEQLNTRNVPHSLENLRSDLSDKFEKFQNDSIERYTKRFGIPPDSGWMELTDYLRAKHIAAALRVILPHALSGDAKVVREVLNNSAYDLHLRMEAVAVLRSVGTADDIPLLLQIAQEHSGESGKLAAEAIASISGSQLELLRKLVETGKTEARRVAARVLSSKPTSELDDVISELIVSEDEPVRIVGVYLLSVTAKGKASALLDAYLEKSRYFYNVVVWLDRLMYSPEHIHGIYFERLKNAALGNE